MYLKPNKILSSKLSRRRLWVHPPEPPKEFLLSDPTKGVYLSKTKLLNVPFFWDFRMLINPHISVVGVTGAGKSYMVKTFLTRANLTWGTNALIIDWVGEYNSWVEQTGGEVLRFGQGSYLNLLDLAGMKPIQRIKQIVSALDILTDIGKYSIQKRFLEQALTEAYKKKKFILTKFENKNPPVLEDVIKELEKIKKTQKTEKKKDEVQECIHRLKPYVMKGNDYFAHQSTVNLDTIIKKGLVNIDLHELPSEEMRSLAGLTILQMLKEKMRFEGWSPDKGLKLFIVADEAWKIAKDDRSDLITIVREGRKYQFGLIVASQNPTDIHKDIFSNVGTLFIMRLMFKDFKDHVRSSLNYSDFVASQIDKLGVGEAVVYLGYAQKTDFSNIILLDKIDGEEPLSYYKLKGDGMEINFEKEKFKRQLKEFGLNTKQVQDVCSTFEEHDNTIHIIQLINKLERYGFGPSTIITFMREMGLKEGELIPLFSKLQREKMGIDGDKLVRLVVEDEEIKED
jgi:DNA helicase HerA-like ATPase